ncbi:hypothetical protein BD289DRAFT_289161 [Coniella lustricola]|uniref:Uncharacterized protein n=1 Tax=Coniella lustricola TaxID=2025994 RepID=A0A2T3A5G9_9PEZI|nr:hypothetical protein BD289DRAFT_289161 [Coniella lustricola]
MLFRASREHNRLSIHASRAYKRAGHHITILLYHHITILPYYHITISPSHTKTTQPAHTPFEYMVQKETRNNNNNNNNGCGYTRLAGPCMLEQPVQLPSLGPSPSPPQTHRHTHTTIHCTSSQHARGWMLIGQREVVVVVVVVVWAWVWVWVCSCTSDSGTSLVPACALTGMPVGKKTAIAV